MADNEDVNTKTFSDEPFFGKPAPVLANIELVRGDKATLKSTGAVTVIYFFTTFYKGAYIVNEELSVLAAKFKDVQFVVISSDPEKEKIEKLLGKIADGSCCDPITKQVFHLPTSYVAWDQGKHATKAYADLLNVSTLHTPQAFVIDAHGNVQWRQGLSQMFKFSDCNFEKQLQLVIEGKRVEQPYGARPKVETEGEAAEVDGEMSLF